MAEPGQPAAPGRRAGGRLRDVQRIGGRGGGAVWGFVALGIRSALEAGQHYVRPGPEGAAWALFP